MDRRGRGLSGAYREGHTSQTDVEDIKAIVDEANTHSIFAISVGAVIALQAALMLTNIEKLAVYEPLLFPNQSAATALMARYGQ
jgi:alpha-beta hydrolase superfamily lysophospholipase